MARVDPNCTALSLRVRTPRQSEFRQKMSDISFPYRLALSDPNCTDLSLWVRTSRQVDIRQETKWQLPRRGRQFPEPNCTDLSLRLRKFVRNVVTLSTHCVLAFFQPQHAPIFLYGLGFLANSEIVRKSGNSPRPGALAFLRPNMQQFVSAG